MTAVCNSCAKYFTQYKKCTKCGRNDEPTSNRTLHDGSKKLLCQKCYTKTLPICSNCSYRRMPFSYRLDKEPLCKTCSLEVTRNCKKCGNQFPAGYGRVCKECNFKKTIQTKTSFIAKSLSQYTSQYFLQYSSWLQQRRGTNFTAAYLQNYQKYFFQIDTLCVKIGRMPAYEELLATFPQATSGRHLLVHLFLHEHKLIQIDDAIKDKYANLNLIEKYLNIFEKEDYKHDILQSYYKRLLSKLKNKKTTLRSIRLSLTPAVKFLQYCDYFKENTPNMNILEGYLWVYPGQRNTLTEFTNFLLKHFSYKLKITMIPQPRLEKAHESQELLQQRLIKILRSSQYQQKYQQYFF